LAAQEEEGVQGTDIEVAKSQVFDETSEKISRFVTACRLYLRMRMREVAVEEQIQWILLYVQRATADIWKENVLEDLEAGVLEYETAGEFLVDLKKEFEGGKKEKVKVAKLRRLEQRRKTMEEFVQKFKRIARGSGYEGQPLIEEFKHSMNGTIW